PSSANKIPVHKTEIYPLPAMEIDESRIIGNVEVLETVYKTELKLDIESEDFTRHAKIVAGDQMSISRQRSIVDVRLGHEDGTESWKHVALMTGLFHAKMADVNAILEVHFGKPHAGNRSPGGLAFHNTLLDRLPIVLTSLPNFRTCRDLIMVSLYGRVLHCLLLVSETASLSEYLSSVTSWAEVEGHARLIYKRFADADRVHELRDLRRPEERRRAAAVSAAKKAKEPINLPTGHVKKGDMVFENGLLFMRDALITREFADAVKAGDSGRLIAVLKLWVFMYRGSGRTKYAYEMLHLIHNLVNVWPKEFRDIIIKNWLVNPTGKEGGWVEVDLLQEHLNFWIKKVYKADGDAHSWDWLAMVSPCIDVLRRLAASIHAEIGTHQGARHSTPDLSRDIAAVMQSLDALKVYRYCEGRVLDDDEKPAP
ncbi:hypothetical protein FA95DRAFT_1459797, partial [Auriscalpium vulgare]